MTDIEIANLALAQLGAKPITAFTDNTVEARLAQQHYQLVRDAVLEDNNWTFAIKRIGPLASLAATPAFQFDYAFTLPGDCIRVVLATWYKATNYIRPQNAIFQVEGRNIMTNYAQIYLKYIAQITNTDMFSPAFVDALSVRMAAEMAIPMTNSLDLQTSLYQLYSLKIREAAMSDGMQGTSQRMPPGSLVSLR